MKKLFVVLIVLSSCSVQNVPLKGKYLETPYEVITDKTFDAVWSNVIDLFAQKGLSIKIVDKASGLIVSETTSFVSNYSFEKGDGTLENPSAWVALSRQSYGGGIMKPQKLTGQWNVRIKSVGNKTSININLTNIDGSYHQSRSQYTPEMNVVFTGKSTGKFEQTIAEQIK